MNRLTEEVKFVNSLTCDERAAGTFNGSLGGTNGWIDTSGYDEVTFLVSLGAIAAGVTPIDVTIYENDTTSGSGTAITNAVTPSQTGGDDDDSVMQVNIRTGGRAAGARKRYVRPTIVAGGTGNFDCNIVALLSRPKSVPVVNSPASVLV